MYYFVKFYLHFCRNAHGIPCGMPENLKKDLQRNPHYTKSLVTSFRRSVPSLATTVLTIRTHSNYAVNYSLSTFLL